MKSYYICSKDVLQHLTNKKFMYVSVYTQYYNIQDYSSALTSINHISSEEILQLISPYYILINKLSKKEITYLTLACRSIKLYNIDCFSYDLKKALQQRKWLIV